MAVLHPLRHLGFMTPRTIGFLITLSWILPLFVFLAPHLAAKLEASGKSFKYFLVFASLFQVCVCLGLMFATTRIFRASWRHRRREEIHLKQLSFNYERERNTARTPDTSSAKVLASVVVVFVTCFSFDIYGHICQLGICEEPEAISYLTPLLKLLNSAANPIAYAFFKKDIKDELRRCPYFCTHRLSEN